MGLDVFLKHSTDRAAALARQQQAEDYSNEVWEKAGAYESLSDEQKDQIREAIKLYNSDLNLDDWGSANDITTIELDSKVHPEHMFKVGYLRSSYNSGGINSVLDRINVPGLYEIFEPNNEYYVNVDWQKARAKATESVATMRHYMTTPMSQYDVIEVNGYDAVGSKEEAMAILKAEIEGSRGFKGGYSNRAGDWFLDGLQIVGAVPGKPSRFGGNPTYYLFTKSSEADNHLNWYLQALEVTAEMIDYVLAQPDPDNYFLTWSS